MSTVATTVLVTATGVLVIGFIAPAILCLCTAARLEEILHGATPPPALLRSGNAALKTQAGS